MGLSVEQGFITAGGCRTWYRVHRNDDGPNDAVPLLMLHGGPGAATPDDLAAVAAVADDRPVIAYDQLDSGRSERCGDPSRWTVEAFVDQLADVRRELGLDEVHLWGQSWGGMLALAYLLSRPSGVRSLTLASAPFSSPLWLAESRRLRAGLPASMQAALDRCEASLPNRPPRVRPARPGPTVSRVLRDARLMALLFPLTSGEAAGRIAIALSRVPFLREPAYELLTLQWLRRHVYRSERRPPVGFFIQAAAMNRVLYRTMWGPSEFVATGVLKDFDLSERLSEVDVPTLITSGRYDEATPDQMQALADAIPDATWVLFEESGHCAEFEEPARYSAVLRDFLSRVEASTP